MRSKSLWIVAWAIVCSASLGVGTAGAQTSDRTARDRAEAAYERARDLVRQEEYQRAADSMREFQEQHRESDRVADALYWEAFSLYRMGGRTQLREAADRLEVLFDRYAQQAREGDGRGLATRIEKELAELGDRRAAERVGQLADQLVELEQSEDYDEDDVRLMALDALLQMDADRAMPILKSVLDRRDAGSASLREKAVFIVSQKETPETAQILMEAARNDPSPKVREQAIFWLGQVPGEKSLDLLMEVIRGDGDPELKEKAVFALSQHDDDRVGDILRDVALDSTQSEEVRGQAIFWLGQHGGGADIDFLRQLYDSLENDELRSQVLFAASQQDGPGAREWLRELALDPDEDKEVRSNAIFWLGQNGGIEVSEMQDLYKALDDTELRGQVLFAASQSGGREVVDFLLDVAKTETDPELRKNAIFWLGQLDDPRVADYLMELLEQE